MLTGLSNGQLVLFGLIILLNIYTYHLFYVDKRRAVNNKRNRIPEKKLLLATFMVGGIGGLLGMTTIRHKTKHTRFKLLVPLSALLTVLVIYFVWTV